MTPTRLRGGGERFRRSEVLDVSEHEDHAAVGGKSREEALPAVAAEREQLLLRHEAAGRESRLPHDRREAFAHLLLRAHFGHHEDRSRRVAPALAVAIARLAIALLLRVRRLRRLRLRVAGDRLLQPQERSCDQSLVVQVALVSDQQNRAPGYWAAHELLEQPLLGRVLRLVVLQRVLVERLLHELQVAPDRVVQRHQLVGHHSGGPVALQTPAARVTNPLSRWRAVLSLPLIQYCFKPIDISYHID